MTLIDLKKSITQKTKAVLMVHTYGLSAEAEEIEKFCMEKNIYLIEDASEAHGQTYNGRKCGSFGDVSTLSFYANKNITTGEGGMLTCNNKHLADQIEIMRLHGMSRDAWKRYWPKGIIPKKGLVWDHYDIKYVGLKYNMIDINAALGIIQLCLICSNELLGIPLIITAFSNSVKYCFDSFQFS